MPSPESTFFVDTSFHISYCFERERHEEARSLIRAIRNRFSNPTFVTTNLIFAETLNLIQTRDWIAKQLRWSTARQVGKDIITYNVIGIITAEMFRLAWELFERQEQKHRSWSFVDFTSFVYIREIRKKQYGQDRLSIKNALAFDSDFDEAGREFGFQVFRE